MKVINYLKKELTQEILRYFFTLLCPVKETKTNKYYLVCLAKLLIQKKSSNPLNLNKPHDYNKDRFIGSTGDATLGFTMMWSDKGFMCSVAWKNLNFEKSRTLFFVRIGWRQQSATKMKAPHQNKFLIFSWWLFSWRPPVLWEKARTTQQSFKSRDCRSFSAFWHSRKQWKWHPRRSDLKEVHLKVKEHPN